MGLCMRRVSDLFLPPDFLFPCLPFVRASDSSPDCKREPYAHHPPVFFDPQAHLDRSIPLSTILTGLRRACSDALTRFNLTTLLIPCFLRHLPVPSATSLWQNPDFQAAFASGNANGQCVGIGLDSSEVGFPPALFKEIWAEASAKGIRRTMHAGEEGGPENVEAAVFELGCERVDHGIRMASDDALMARIAERKTLVTVCPLSNVELRCVKSVAEVPIKKFLEAGVRFSINSDDPAYFGGFVLDNYCAVQEAHGLGKEEWTRICENAIEGSWCGEERKEEMRGLLRECVKEFESK